MTTVDQYVETSKYTVAGKNFLGNFSISQTFQFGAGYTPDKKHTAFKVIFHVKVVYDNGTMIDFSAFAINQFETPNQKPGYDFFMELADDACPKLLKQFTRHADYILFGIEDKEVGLSDKEISQMKLVIDLY